MALIDKIGDDLKAALKAGQKVRLETLRTVRAALLEKQVEKRPSGGMTEEDEITVLLAASKKRKEAIEIYRQHGRDDLADTEQLELSIIQEYLPKQMTPEEIESVIRQIINETGAAGPASFSKVMPLAMKELKGKCDGKLVQQTVKQLLGA